MKTKYIKPTVDAASEIEAPVVLAAVVPSCRGRQ